MLWPLLTPLIPCCCHCMSLTHVLITNWLDCLAPKDLDWFNPDALYQPRLWLAAYLRTCHQKTSCCQRTTVAPVGFSCASWLLAVAQNLPPPDPQNQSPSHQDQKLQSGLPADLSLTSHLPPGPWQQTEGQAEGTVCHLELGLLV